MTFNTSELTGRSRSGLFSVAVVAVCWGTSVVVVVLPLVVEGSETWSRGVLSDTDAWVCFASSSTVAVDCGCTSWGVVVLLLLFDSLSLLMCTVRAPLDSTERFTTFPSITPKGELHSFMLRTSFTLSSHLCFQRRLWSD